MTVVYPSVFTPLPEGGYMAYVPDLCINTQGESLAQAIDMARDAICLMCVDREDDGLELPVPTPAASVPHDACDTVSLVDADLDAYRRMQERRSVRRNVTLPSWLNAEADKAGLNVSAVLQEALKNKLGLV